MGCLRFFGNLIWFLTGGIITALSWWLFGLLWCITIVGIPFGVECFKLGAFSLFPFGKTVVTHFSKYPLFNTLWLLLCGWEIAVVYIITGFICCITIIGIPFGKQCFKLVELALFPFGSEIN